MNIIFMGTPDFAVSAFNALIQGGHTISAVFCQPDRPKGRGHKLLPPPVKEAAMAQGIPVYQPNTLKDGEALKIIEQYNPQCIVVVAYGKLLPKEILEYPQYGCVNIHASLLPKYRGAAPIQWAVLNGDEITGVTTMKMDIGMDTGDILLQKEFPIPHNMTSGELFEALAPLGGELIVETLAALEQGTVTPTPQKEEEATHAAMLDRSLSLLDFSQSAQTLHNTIRGLHPWPCAKFAFGEKAVKVHASKVVEGKGKPGEVLRDKQLVVACGENTALHLTRIQFEGAKPMADEDALRGHPIPKGTQLQ